MCVKVKKNKRQTKNHQYMPPKPVWVMLSPMCQHQHWNLTLFDVSVFNYKLRSINIRKCKYQIKPHERIDCVCVCVSLDSSHTTNWFHSWFPYCVIIIPPHLKNFNLKLEPVPAKLPAILPIIVREMNFIYLPTNFGCYSKLVHNIFTLVCLQFIFRGKIVIIP